MNVKLSKHTDGWLPTKFHGEIPLVEGEDPEVTVASALKKLMIPSQIPRYTHIKYMIKTDETTASAAPKMKLSVKKKKIKTIFFELLDD